MSWPSGNDAQFNHLTKPRKPSIHGASSRIPHQIHPLDFLMSQKLLLPRAHLGRTPTWSASLALSVASVSITSSFSTSVTCAACFRPIFAITTKQERIYRSTRTARGPVRYTCPPPARSSRSQKSVGCIIVTSVARREFSQRPKSRVHFGAGGRLICNSGARMRLAPRHHT